VVIIDGIRFGMILQFAIGPICLLVFRTSGTLGLFQGITVVIGVALIDALYIFLASIGMGSILDNSKIKRTLKYIGGIVIIIFGFNIILNSFNFTIIPNIRIVQNNTHNAFVQGLILTISNPLSIIFWGGVFSGKIGNENYSKFDIFQFGIGCIISTITFLSVIAVIGSIVNVFLTEIVINVINAIVGFIIILFGIKIITRREQDSSRPNVA
jgi:threonine/homoserine/homoserine lactone efflux protein